MRQCPMLFSLYSQISLYRFWLKAWFCSASDQKYSFKITFLKMILSWLQNYFETLGGRTAWSWHLSCVQTVVKLQLHSVLAALYLLSTLRNAHFLLTLFQTVKREKATSQVLQRLPQRNLFLPLVFADEPLRSSLLCLATGHGRSHCSLEVSSV